MPIKNSQAYENAVSTYIVRNAQKTFKRTVEDAEKIIGWILDNGHDGLGDRANDFAASLLNSYRTYGKLTERQCEAVRKCLARDAEYDAQYQAKKLEWQIQNEIDKANAEDVPEGRIVITGEILSTKVQDSEWGEQLKCVIRDDRGFKLFGSVPSAIEDYAYSEEIELKGSRISLTATVTQANDDTKFGYFKRPAKAELI